MSKQKKYIDLFAGAGGFGLGFTMAGLKPLLSIEADKWACDTLKHNSDHKVLNKRIEYYNSPKKILNVVHEQPDIIIGGPPCQGFSHAGKRLKDDERNEMYIHFVHWVKVLEPRIFVIENVIGLLNFVDIKGHKIIDKIKDSFDKIGYSIGIWKLNAVDYGVPQNRVRIFIVGIKDNFCVLPPQRTHSPSRTKSTSKYVTVNQAIADLPLIRAKEGSEEMCYTRKPRSAFQKWSRMDNETLHNHVAMKHTNRIVARYQNIIDGESLDNLDSSLKVFKRNGNGELSDVRYSSNYRYLQPHKPSFTIPAHFYSSFIHPYVPRNITAREAARIQSFPDNYVFKGQRTMISSKLLAKLGKSELDLLSQYNQIGNAVPPKLAEAIAKRLLPFL